MVPGHTVAPGKATPGKEKSQDETQKEWGPPAGSRGPGPREALEDPVERSQERPTESRRRGCVHCLSPRCLRAALRAVTSPRPGAPGAPGARPEPFLGTPFPSLGRLSVPEGGGTRKLTPWAEAEVELGRQSPTAPPTSGLTIVLTFRRRKTLLHVPVWTPRSGPQEGAASAALSS